MTAARIQKPERDPRTGEPLTTGTPPAATESVYYVSGSDVYHVRADCVALYGRLSTPR